MTDPIRDILRSIDADEASRLAVEASLQQDGGLNSLQLLDLILELERRYGIKVENAEVIPENLDSIAGIARFVERKTRSGVSSG